MTKVDRAFEHCCLYAGQDFVEHHVKMTGDRCHVEFTGKDFTNIVQFNFEIEPTPKDFIAFLTFLDIHKGAANEASFRTWSIAAIFEVVFRGRS